MKIEKGKYIVLKSTVKNMKNIGKECVFYIDSLFPVDAFQDGINEGRYEAREATQNEKAFCYDIYNKLNKRGVDLDYMNEWLELKKI